MTTGTEASGGKTWFGHPRGLSTLFFTELWERFSYYGMKAMLFLYITAAALDTTEGGAGLGIGEQTGGAISGLYNFFVYLLALPGGWLADRLIGQRRAVLYGGCIIACGHYSMAVPGLLAVPEMPFFYGGLILIIIGTGLLKPNISTMVGELYEGDHGARRDAGFSIFYMGINLGAFIAPIACGWLRKEIGWHFGFGLAGVGMTAGVIWYLLDQKHLGTAGLDPKIPAEELPKAKKQAMIGGLLAAAFLAVMIVLHTSGTFVLTWTGVAEFMSIAVVAIVGLYLFYVAFFCHLAWDETKKVLVIGILFAFTALFWSGFEQAATSLNAFANELTDRSMFGWTMPPEWFQSINALFIIVLSPVFAWIWIKLASKNLNPSIPIKFALGLLQLGAGFVVIMFAATLAAGMEGIEGFADQGVSPLWLTMMYLLFTTGELCLSPVGLSSITKLAPRAFVSQMMGIWFIAAALGNLIAGQVGGKIEAYPHATIFRIVAMIIGGGGILLLIFAPVIQKRMMGNVK